MNWGPRFGGAHGSAADLAIADQANTNMSSYSKLGSNYSKKDIDVGKE